MHSYLRAIGFSKLNKESEAEALLEDVFKHYQYRDAVKEENRAFLELRRNVGPDMGIRLCGDLDEEGFHQQYYFPYYEGSGITTTEDLIVEKRINGESYSGVCDDGRIGVSLIFYVQNPAAYLKKQRENQLRDRRISTTFSGLSIGGMILLPVHTDSALDTEKEQISAKRKKLMSEAKNGNPEAIESLTIEDMDLYSMLSRRIVKEDVYTIVDTFFMPYGIECDQYQIMGNINYYAKVQNSITGESVYQMNIECNDMNFDICINEADLTGSPEIGRRFKGNIWLQGKINVE